VIWGKSEIFNYRNRFIIKYDNKEFSLYNKSNSPLAKNAIWSIAIDDNNILWFASCAFETAGLMKFDGKNWTIFTPENSKLPSNLVQDVVVDNNNNNKWVAMSEVVNNGCIIKITDNNWTIFDKGDMGFIPYYFGNMAVDADNNMYASIN